jgi:CBS domain-containing protein
VCQENQLAWRAKDILICAAAAFWAILFYRKKFSRHEVDSRTLETAMKVSDILRVKGTTLFTVTPSQPLSEAVDVMSEKDIGSVVVMEYGDLVGMLTFREVIQAIVKNGGQIGSMTVRSAMDEYPMTCTSETDLDEVRRMMLDRHARYMPVMDKRMLVGVISLYDVAKAVVDSQNFENQMLKAYIRDWPSEEPAEPKGAVAQ